MIARPFADRLRVASAGSERGGGRPSHEVWTDGPGRSSAARDAGAHSTCWASQLPNWHAGGSGAKARCADLRQAVALLTSVPPELYGFHDRGPGARVLGGHRPVRSGCGGAPAPQHPQGLPGAAGIFADSVGDCVWPADRRVTGRTDRRAAGRVLRRGRDTHTPRWRSLGDEPRRRLAAHLQVRELRPPTAYRGAARHLDPRRAGPSACHRRRNGRASPPC